jgi:hypothetical protein
MMGEDVFDQSNPDPFGSTVVASNDRNSAGAHVLYNCAVCVLLGKLAQM